MLGYRFIDGISTSVFSILVVFIVLIILALIIEWVSKLLPKDKVEKPIQPMIHQEDDKEEQVVARIIAGILCQKESTSNVVIKSIKRVK